MFPTPVDIDLIGFYREETIAGACVFVVREGRTQRTCEFILDKGQDVPQEELVAGFVKRYYDETADIPSEVDIACELEDAELIGAWLSGKADVRAACTGRSAERSAICSRPASATPATP